MTYLKLPSTIASRQMNLVFDAKRSEGMSLVGPGDESKFAVFGLAVPDHSFRCYLQGAFRVGRR